MKQVFINLPVKNVNASVHFYSQLGFTINPLFTFDNQKCMAWGDQIYVMLQTQEMFQPGNKKTLPDTRQNTTATFTLPVDSLRRVNEMMEKGLETGGRETTPLLDEGYMQLRNIEDPDGHNWGILYLDINKFKEMTGRTTGG